MMFHSHVSMLCVTMCSSFLYLLLQYSSTPEDHNVCFLVDCLTSKPCASVPTGRICSDRCMCCHTEIEVADQTLNFIQSQYTDSGRTSPSTDPITPGAWQGSHWNANFEITGIARPRKIPVAQADTESKTCRSQGICHSN